MDAFVGEIAALMAALGFSINSVCYTFAGRKVDAVTSIAMSLPMSAIMVMVIHQIMLGEFFPVHATADRWFFLGASGILAFIVASYFMLNAYQHIGPRVAVLILSFAPVLGALFAWIFLGQVLPANAIIGMAVVLFGIIWVVAERGKPEFDSHNRNVRLGVLYACLGTLAQSTAFIFSTQGVAGGFPPISATLIRITAGVIALWVFIAFQGKVGSTTRIFKRCGRLFLQLAGAALFGPVIAGSFLLLSFQHVPVGVSTTLSHITSIILIPVGYFVFNERITVRAVLGAVVTVAGIGILFNT
ncbi:MAG: DMT family transporter [Anaerolineae bacterium]